MNAKKLLSTLLSAAMAVSMLAGCFGGGGNKNYSDEAADAANAAQSTVVFATDTTLAKSLQDALADGLTQLDEIDDAMEADENLKPLLTSGWDLDIFAAQGEDAEAAAKTIAEQYIVSAVIGKKAEGKIAMVLHDGNGYYYVAVLTYGGGSGSGGGTGGGSGSGDGDHPGGNPGGGTDPDDPNKPGTGDDDDENSMYDVTVTWNGNGTVKADKATVKAGETVTITVTPKDGYQIDKIVHEGGTFNYVRTESGSLTYTISNVTGDVKFHVTFKEAAPDASTVTFTVGEHGTVTRTADNEVINDGATFDMVPDDMMIFKVSPDQYYEAVVTYTGCTVVDNKDDTYTLSNVDDNATVTVTFEEVVYEISAISSDNGHTIVNPSKVYPAKGQDSVTITARPDSGYEVDQVTVSTGAYEEIGDNTYKWTGIDGDATVRVTFKKSIVWTGTEIQNSKPTYSLGDKFDASALTVTAIYSVGTEEVKEDVNSYRWSCDDENAFNESKQFAKTGGVTITVTYTDKFGDVHTAETTVTVNDKAPVATGHLRVTPKNSDKTYTVGNDVLKDDLKVEIEYKDALGNIFYQETDDFEITNNPLETVGDKVTVTVKATQDGKTLTGSTTVTVEEKEHIVTVKWNNKQGSVKLVEGSSTSTSGEFTTTVNDKDSITIKVDAAKGYTVQEVATTTGTVLTPSIDQYTLSNITSDITINVTFKAVTPKITGITIDMDKQPKNFDCEYLCYEHFDPENMVITVTYDPNTVVAGEPTTKDIPVTQTMIDSNAITWTWKAHANKQNLYQSERNDRYWVATFTITYQNKSADVDVRVRCYQTDIYLPLWGWTQGTPVCPDCPTWGENQSNNLSLTLQRHSEIRQ